MLNAGQHHEVLGHDPHQEPAALFGKPWFWQRSSGAMEGTRTLARVIMEMREEIRKLEQNRALTKDREEDQEQTQEGVLEEEHENLYGNLRRNASAPILKRQFKEREENVMTVRRYSRSSSTPEMTQTKGIVDPWERLSHFGWGRLQEEVRGGNGNPDHSVSSDVASAKNRTSLQECVQKTRVKVKTVTFLLPVDDIYTSKPVLSKPQEPTTTELTPITDTESREEQKWPLA
ncbi:uncharacterized protein LOC133155278 isoform X2 [Syngnathus typhle]|uniref:uncharacterized protein LOC133155032 isoform X2 n=1 Tax=Syngnathus typhle TaxID=161592 RepID=UPI002A6B521B|nr:uncharacterized protein LOC133155032 isoform X2 [Syngnathus typhle]XP_061136456.1 uncharacterized protein LOC133155278 isoform X2 [Syngnathus typhle]